jgi:hypothetical protein
VVIAMQNKPIAMCGVVATAVLLTGATIALDSVIPRGTMVGFAMQMICLVAVIGMLLVGFNFVCDWLEAMAAKRNRKVYDQPRRKPTVLTYRGITHSDWNDEFVATASRSLSGGARYSRHINRERLSANGQPAVNGQPAANGSRLHDVAAETPRWIGQ